MLMQINTAVVFGAKKCCGYFVAVWGVETLGHKLMHLYFLFFGHCAKDNIP